MFNFNDWDYFSVLFGLHHDVAFRQLLLLLFLFIWPTAPSYSWLDWVHEGRLWVLLSETIVTVMTEVCIHVYGRSATLLSSTYPVSARTTLCWYPAFVILGDRTLPRVHTVVLQKKWQSTWYCPTHAQIRQEMWPNIQISSDPRCLWSYLDWMRWGQWLTPPPDQEERERM